MKLIKRLTTSVTATVGKAVGRLENHDAIINATIRETRQSVAKTKARINTLRQQQSVFESQLKDAFEQANVWQDRARDLADSDQDKALQCLARHNQCLKDGQRLQESVVQQQQLIRQISSNLGKLQGKLEKIQHKQNLLKSRQLLANANHAEASSQCEENLQDTFERWESMVLEHELSIVDQLSADPLEEDFEQRESEAELLQQLARLQVNEKE